jgi:hemoglobin-like flavoprotein
MTVQRQLLEESLELVKTNASEFSALFYDRLFRDYPEVKPLFANTNIEKQEKKLIASLVMIVENLRSPEALQEALKSLGARHVQVGTIEEYYPMVGDALLQTFKEYLGDKWTSEREKAWIYAYSVICTLMLQGAENPEAYLDGELTFYEWLDLYGEYNPALMKTIAELTSFQYGRPETTD